MLPHFSLLFSFPTTLIFYEFLSSIFFYFSLFSLARNSVISMCFQISLRRDSRCVGDGCGWWWPHAPSFLPADADHSHLPGLRRSNTFRSDYIRKTEPAGAGIIRFHQIPLDGRIIPG
ncbi:hypothetical protein ABW19_dt0202132 [Dactylella cylindrospora]|nr:hypothetical protein ABW19_dt0202132 [Dactylella cylindrospora]